MELKQLLKQYRAIENQIHKYFDFDGRWHVYPIEDLADKHWKLETE